MDTVIEQQYRSEIEQLANNGGDMCLHIATLFDEVLAAKPRLIVELGIRGGISTFGLERGAMLCGAHMVCVDRDDWRTSCQYAEFVQSDDVEFASQFLQFCNARNWPPIIGILMIDTEHTYEQTKREIEAWLPHMAEDCRIIFHDTNAQPYYFGVAEYLRELLTIPFVEDQPFICQSNGWVVRHNPDCFGLTILQRNKS